MEKRGEEALQKDKKGVAYQTSTKFEVRQISVSGETEIDLDGVLTIDFIGVPEGITFSDKNTADGGVFAPLDDYGMSVPNMENMYLNGTGTITYYVTLA